MSSGIRPEVNPNRVPDTLVAIEPSQKGQPRVIHPVAMLVGEITTGDETMIYNAEPSMFAVPADGSYIDDFGFSIAYEKGDQIPLDRANQFKAFREPATLAGELLEDEIQILKNLMAPPEDAAPDPEAEEDEEVEEVAPDEDVSEDVETEERAEEAAPENRMEPAPANRRSGKRS